MRKRVSAGILGRHKRAILGLGTLLLLVGVAGTAPVIALHDPAVPALTMRLRPPVWEERGVATHLLGTDQLGRDVFARVLFGARLSLFVAGTAVLIATVAGTAAGLVAGYYRGAVDFTVSRVADVQLALPALLLAITLLAVLPPSIGNLILVLSIGGWVVFARLIRSRVLHLREREFVEAARVVGCSDARIVLRHLLPNVAPTVVVVATFQMAHFMIAEASLSYLGLGIRPPDPSWGSMISEAQLYLDTAWWLATFPGLVMILAVSAIGLTGDWLRDVLDPRSHYRLT